MGTEYNLHTDVSGRELSLYEMSSHFSLDADIVLDGAAEPIPVTIFHRLTPEQLAGMGAEALKAAWLHYKSNEDFKQVLQQVRQWVDREAWPTDP